MIFTQERKSASQIVPSSEKGSVLMILLDSLVTISQSHPWAGLRGCEAVVVQVLESAVILELIEGVQTVLDKHTKEHLRASHWFVPVEYIETSQVSNSNYLDELEMKVQDLEDSLTAARCCLEVSEQLRDELCRTNESLIEEIDKLRKDLYDLRGY